MPANDQYANNPASTLGAGIAAGDTTLTVASAASFSAIPQFRIIIDSELLLVTGVSGTTFTVARGIEGTTAAAHSSGAVVTQVLTRDGLLSLGSQIHYSDSYAAIPSSSLLGRTFWPNNGISIYRDTGSAWNPWGPIYPMATPPAAASFTGVNVTTATLTSNAGSLFLNAPNIAVAHGQFWVKTLAAGAYTWIANLANVFFLTNDCQCGLALRSTGTSKIITFEHQALTTSTSLRVIQWTDANTRSNSALNLGLYGDSFAWMKITDDGTTNRTYSVSRDGSNWIDVLTESRTTFIGSAPDQAGIFATANGAAVGLGVYSWSGV
jgi:hypothetical protein